MNCFYTCDQNYWYKILFSALFTGFPCYFPFFQVFNRLATDTGEPSPKDVALRTNFTLSGLEPYTRYDVAVQALTGPGGGEKSNVQVMTDESGEPQGRGDFLLSFLGQGGIMVWTCCRFYSFSSYAMISWLIFIVQLISKSCFPLLPLNLEPSPVREVSISQDKITSYSIEVAWLPPDKPNGKIGYYFFYWESSAGSSTAESFVLPGSVHYKLVSGLKPFTNYTFSVVPYNLRKNLSGRPFNREGQTSATGMHFTPFTSFIYLQCMKKS